MWFDLFLLGMVLVGILLGTWKGLAWQLAGIFSVILGFVLGRPLSMAISGQMEEPSVFTHFLIFAVCYAAISLGCYLLALLWRKKLEGIKLERYDRHMGGFVGAVNGLILWAMISMFIVAFSEDLRKDILSRPTGKVLGRTLDGVHGVMPDGLHEILHPFMHSEKEDPPALEEKKGREGHDPHSH